MISEREGNLVDNDPRLANDQVNKIMTSIKDGYDQITSTNKLKEDIVLVLGKTGTGKSTIINYLGGVELIGYDENEEIKIKALNNPIAIIGASMVS